MGSYDDSSIKVLSDIEHIRSRSSMYISTDRPSYQMWTEIADNAIDEAMNGYADTIKFDIDYGRSYISVEDNGRGLPQGMNEELNKPTVFAVYQKLNAGGKYDQESYSMSGGLNGVGSTVINALSKELNVVTWRDSSVVSVSFSYGETLGYDKRIDKSYSGSGTKVSYVIDTDHRLFTDRLKDYEKEIEDKIHLLKTLMPNVNFIYNGKTVDVKDFRDFLMLSNEPLLDQSILLDHKNIMVALNWSEDTNKATERSYCNSIYTHNGGDHVKAVYDAICDLLGSDASYGVNIAISVMYPAVEYDSQAKTKAISKDMRQWVKDIVTSDLKAYFRKNQDIRDKISELIKRKRNELNKRNNKSSVRRDKKTAFMNALGSSAFSDCTTKDRSEAELFIVEGNSAAGSARQARNVDIQAIMPLRGKVINSYTNSVEALLKNQEVSTIFSSIDCGIFQDVNVSKSRYSKIIIMADADPDGQNIACLLIALFTFIAPELIEHGYLYLALPPLYGTYDKGKFIPIYTEDVKEDYLNKGYSISRYKGLGECDPEVLEQCCMNHNTRRLIRLKYTESCESIVSEVMGGDSQARKKLLISSGVLFDE